ncbi:MAG: ROK family protein [Acidimicrobiaceae bacterium]|nr:ROK family protein [Acidimicrobiaceae bacterium]
MGADALGVDIGGTKLLAVRVPQSGSDVREEIRLPTPSDGRAAVRSLREAVRSLFPEGSAPAAIGVGIPGLVDWRGRLGFSPHRPSLVGFPLRAALEQLWPATPAWVGNDATAAVWAEHQRGAGSGVDDVLMVTLGTGIGGGVVSDGRLREGAHRFAGEFGHMVVDPNGPLCACGKRGCWERFASGDGLGVLGREAALADRAPRVCDLAGGDPEAVRGEHVTAAAAEGDADAEEIMARFAWWLALGLASLANAFDPSVIVVGGGLADAGDVLLEPTRSSFASLVEAPEERAGLRVVPAALGSRAGAVGAGLLAAGW